MTQRSMLLHFIFNKYDASLCIKFITTRSTIILNGYSYDNSITGDLDVYKYNVINIVPTNSMTTFAILKYTKTTPFDTFPYDYMQIGYSYKIDDEKIINNTAEVTWACFCIPR